MKKIKSLCKNHYEGSIKLLLIFILILIFSCMYYASSNDYVVSSQINIDNSVAK